MLPTSIASFGIVEKLVTGNHSKTGRSEEKFETFGSKL